MDKEKQHEPELYINPHNGMWVVKCKKCGYVLWEQTVGDNCQPPAGGDIGVQVEESIRTRDIFGG